MSSSISNSGTSILFISAWASTSMSMLEDPAVQIRQLPQSSFEVDPQKGADVYAFPQRGRLMSAFPIHPSTTANRADNADPVRLIKDGSGLRASPSQLKGVKQFVARQKDRERHALALDGDLTDYPDLLNVLLETAKPIGFSVHAYDRKDLKILEAQYTLGMDREEIIMGIDTKGGRIVPDDLAFPTFDNVFDLVIDEFSMKYVVISRHAVVTVSTEELKKHWDFGTMPPLLRASAPGQPGRTFLDVLMDTMREDFEATRRLMYDMFRIDVWIEPLAEGLKLPTAEGGEALPRALIEAGFLGDVKDEPHETIREFLVEYYGADRLASIAKRHGLSEHIAGSKGAEMKQRVEGAPISRIAVIFEKVLGWEIDLKDIASEGEVFDIDVEWPSLFEHVLENVGKMTWHNLRVIHDALLQKYERAWASIDPEEGKEAFIAVAREFQDDLGEAFGALAILEELFIKIGITTNLFKNPAARSFVTRRILYSLLTQDMEEVYDESMILHLAGTTPRDSSFKVLDNSIEFDRGMIFIDDGTVKSSLATFIESSDVIRGRYEALIVEQGLILAEMNKDYIGTYNPFKAKLNTEMADEATRRKLVESAQGDDSIKGRVIRALSHLVDGNLDGAEVEMQAATEAFTEGRLAP